MKLTEKLLSHRPLLVVELKPDDHDLMTLVGKVKPYVDAVRLTALKNSGDPQNLGRTAEKICVESAINVAQAAQIDVVASIVCRDHPKDDLDLLLTLKRSGVENLIALYGDPNDPPYPNYYHFTSSADLIRWVRKQESMLPSHEVRFCIVVGSDPTSKDINKQVLGLMEKKHAGADITITQPVFDPEQGRAFVRSLAAINEKIPVLVGLLALKSEKSVSFLEKRLGVNIPMNVKKRIEGKGVEEGLEIVKDVSRAISNEVDGYYVYPWADPDLSVTISLVKQLEGI